MECKKKDFNPGNMVSKIFAQVIKNFKYFTAFFCSLMVSLFTSIPGKLTMHLYRLCRMFNVV